MKFILRRIAQTDNGTFGVLVRENGIPFGVTVERSWRNNQENVSCIPAGTYIAKRYLSPKRGYNVWTLEGVKDRSDIEIHIANIPAELEGCIALGVSFAFVSTPKHGADNGVTSSGMMFHNFMEETKDVEELTITIIDLVGPVGEPDAA